MAELKEILVPDIGDFEGVEVIEILVSPGASVNVEDPLVSLESDKAAMEIPSEYAGTIKEIKVKVGDKVSEGDLLLIMEAEETQHTEPAPVETKTEAPAKQPAPAPKPAPKPAAVSRPASSTPTAPGPVDEDAFRRAYASPSVRKFARELGADLGRITGTGNKGRILKDDVKAFVKQILTSGGGFVSGGLQVEPMPDIDFSQFGDIETQPLTKINKLTGKFLHRNWVTVPHVTQFDEADITDLENFRKTLNEKHKDEDIKVTVLAFLMKALAKALEEFPRFNASLDNSGENLIIKKYIHIGVAVDTPAGLVVPVVRDVNNKSLIEIGRELIAVSKKARDKKLSPGDLSGGCMSISSLGGIGGTSFTPIVNSPEVAILGVSRASMKPVYQNDNFVPRLMLPLSLSYDHRVIDGADGARFTTFLSNVLSGNPENPL